MTKMTKPATPGIAAPYTMKDLNALTITRGWGYNQPRLTLAQVADIMGACYIGDSWADTARNLLNLACEDAPPKYAAPHRPVRIKDLKPGDVLQYCGHEAHGRHRPSPKVGDLCVVDSVSPGDFALADGTIWSGSGWSFVRRPFKAGEVVTCPEYAAPSMWSGNMLIVGAYYCGMSKCITASGVTGCFWDEQLKRVF